MDTMSYTAFRNDLASLMASPKNAARLNDAINQVAAGKATPTGVA